MNVGQMCRAEQRPQIAHPLYQKRTKAVRREACRSDHGLVTLVACDKDQISRFAISSLDLAFEIGSKVASVAIASQRDGSLQFTRRTGETNRVVKFWPGIDLRHTGQRALGEELADQPFQRSRAIS